MTGNYKTQRPLVQTDGNLNRKVWLPRSREKRGRDKIDSIDLEMLLRNNEKKQRRSHKSRIHFMVDLNMLVHENLVDAKSI